MIWSWDEELGCYYEKYFVDDEEDETDPPIDILEGEDEDGEL